MSEIHDFKILFYSSFSLSPKYPIGVKQSLDMVNNELDDLMYYQESTYKVSTLALPFHWIHSPISNNNHINFKSIDNRYDPISRITNQRNCLDCQFLMI